MSERFVDHVQLLPLPSRDGVRQPDGGHRPGGLGLRNLSDRLGDRGWTARVEDFGIERKLAEPRLAEAYARAIGDAVISARDRNRFPVVLSLVNFCALGVMDGLGAESGMVWVSPEGSYGRSSLLRRPRVDRTVLSRITGRQRRDRFAIAPVVIPGSSIVVVGGQEIRDAEARALAEDGVRLLTADRLGELAGAVAKVGASEWYLHVDATAFPPGVLPAADRPTQGGLVPERLAAAARRAFEGSTLTCVGIARYDLNRESELSLPSLAALLDRLLMAAGGEPDPRLREEAEAR